MTLNLTNFKEILTGKYKKIPELRKKVVRIFLSSTFTDTNSERDYLIENVYPKLRTYCKKNHDLDFQTVDMRWGIPNDAYEYHNTTKLCIKEIKNCKKYSIGPNFVTLISQKYGLRPLPTRIDEKEFEILKLELEPEDDLSIEHSYENEDEIITYKIENILDTCYKLDSNLIPANYCLLPISKIIIDYNSTEPKRQENSRFFWDLIQTKLSNLLRKCADSAFQKGLLDVKKKDRYFISITEKEIFEGIFQSENPNESCLCFIRNIDNIDDNLNDVLIPRFTDIKINKQTQKAEIDQEAKQLIDDLKYKKIPSVLDKKNIFSFNVKWTNNSINKQDMSIYLEQFGNCFYNQIVRLIEQAILSEKNQDNNLKDIYFKLGFDQNEDMIKKFKDFITEIILHANQYNDITDKFFGRDDITLEIKNYLMSDNNLPFLVTGESGCGKTSVIAIVHKSIPTWFGDFKNYIIITRFLGTTTESSSIFKTYSSIALQLFYIINLLTESKSKDIYNQYLKAQDIITLRDLIYFELNELYRIDPSKKVIILLDSLDQLSPNDYKNTDKWFLTNLNSNVKLIVSTLPDHGNLLENLNIIIAKKFDEKFLEDLENNSLEMSTTANFGGLFLQTKDFLLKQVLEVKSLRPEESELILSNWLQAANKQLTQSQWEDLRYIFVNANLLPLFLKLIFDIVIRWKSFDEQDLILKKCLEIDDIILYLFERLEKLHGKVIFQRAICYMTVCKNGINDYELEDILSLDDDVLYSVFQYHIPPIRRLPTILWIRIKKDLEEYLVEKEANDTKVIYWYHRRFVEVSLKSYIKTLNKQESDSLFQNIFDFYNETWKGRQKPFVLNDYLKKKLKNTSNNNQADRYISSQPIKYIGKDGKVRYNKRKLTELPNCLANINSLFGLEKACDLVFYNYEFMSSKFVCESINEVVDDINKILNEKSSFGYSAETKFLINEIKLLFKCLSLCGNEINDNPASLAFQISSRLMNYYGKLKHVTSFIDQCDSTSLSDCAILSPYLQQEGPGGYLNYSIRKHVDEIIDIVLVLNYILTISRSKICVNVFSNKTAAYLFDVKIPNQYSGSSILKIKTLMDDYEMANKIGEKLVFNQETLPVSFLIIRPDMVLVLTSEEKIRFIYKTDTEILDSYCIGGKQLIVVEKFKNFCKIFPDFEIGSIRKVNKVEVCKDVKIVAVKSTSSSFQTQVDVELDLLFVLSSDEMIQFMFVYGNLKEVEDLANLKNINSKPIVFSAETDDEDDEYEDIYEPEDAKTIKSKFIKLNKNLSYQIKKYINRTGLDDLTNVVKIENSNFARYFLKYAFQKMYSFKTAPFFLSTKSGHFVIMNLFKSFSNCYVFKNFTSEPILEIIEPYFKETYKHFYASFLTKNYFYLVHPNKNKKGLCKLEIKEKCDYVQYLNKNYYILSRDGIIELYKLKCLNNVHRTKLIFSINSLSRNLPKLIFLDRLLLTGSCDGVFNLYDIIFGKRNMNIYPSFDRTFESIHKIYLTETYALSVSKKSEFTLWDYKIGRIKSTLRLEEKNLNGLINKIKLIDNLLVLLVNNSEIGLFDKQTGEFIKKLEIKIENEQKLIFLDRELSSSKLELFDLNNLIHIQINLDPYSKSFRKINQSDESLKDQKLILFIKELDSILFIDKYLNKFFLKSFSSEDLISNQDNFFLRYANHKDENLVKKFFNLYGQASRFKFKILHQNDKISYLALTAQKYNQQEEKYENVNSLIISLKINLALNKKNLIELEIQNVYPFCFKYSLIKKAQEIYLVFNYWIELSIESCVDKNDFFLIESNRSKQKQNLVQILNLNSSEKIFELNSIESKIKNIAVDMQNEYLAFSDESKLVWLYRIKDKAKLASLPLYGEIRQIKFSYDNRFLCFNMNDRRIFTVLLVDPKKKEHLELVKNIRSDLLKYKNLDDMSREEDADLDDQEHENLEKIAENGFSSDGDGVDSTSDSSDTSDEEKVEDFKTKIKKSVHKQEDFKKQRIKLFEKSVHMPIEIKGQNFNLDKLDWVKNYLEKIENNIKSESQLSKNTEDDVQEDSEIENDYHLENKKENHEVKSFGNELKAIMATNYKQAEPKLKNSGYNVRTANISSKACIIS